MKKKEYHISDFSPHLFWDVDRNKLDWEKNRSQIVSRVLEYGLWSDWKLIEQYYGKNRIGEICKTLRSLDAKTITFISTITGIPKESFRCCILKQSIPRHWDF